MSPGSAPERRPQPPPGYRPAVTVLVAVCAGIVADRASGAAPGAWLALTAAGWLAWFAFYRGNRGMAAALVLLVAVAGSGGLWHHLRWRYFPANDLGKYARPWSQPVCVEVEALESPRPLPAPPPDPLRIVPLEDRVQLDVRPVGLRSGKEWIPVAGLARLTIADRWPAIVAGDRLRVFGQLSAPGEPRNPGAFDFAGLQRGARVRCRLTADGDECVTVVGRAGWGSPRRGLDRVRSVGRAVLARHVDSRQFPLAAALVLGLREELDYEQSRAFWETGMAHILSISGLHVGLLAAGLFGMAQLAMLPRRKALWWVAMLVVSYTVLSGAEPPALRATVLVLVLCAARWMRRPALPLNSLATAGLVVLAINPADLFNTGVQLSFLAVAGIMWHSTLARSAVAAPDPLDRLIEQSRRWPARTWDAIWKQAVNVTLLSAVVWLVTLPLILARFHLMTPVALVLNTLVCWPMAVALVSGFGVLLVGGLVPPLGAVLGWICNLSLAISTWLIEVAQSVPYGHFFMPGPASWWLAGFYGGLGLWLVFPKWRPRPRWAVAAVVGWGAVGIGASLAGRGDRLECTFLAVGHGSATVLRLPSGETILFDAGQSMSPEQGARTVADCLWSQGVARIDAVIISHPDADHYNALPGLLERFPVGEVCVSPLMFREESRALVYLRESIEGHGVPIRTVAAGDRFAAGEDCRVEVLHPPARCMLGDDNANSLVLAVEYRGRRLLLPGDLSSPGLEWLLATPGRDCDVLVAPHHGSRESDPPGLAAWCRPEWVVISGGERYHVDETALAYRQLGARIMHTARTGAIMVRIRGSELAVSSYLEGEMPERAGTPRSGIAAR